ncbi:hypothetical protein QBC44DRAFT_128533 [Cladorrhinum sp. PSN332]|nr:hypothetical protein QBC44DRAFT_128533 [Cladorrhinum sp. PSN332]
MAFNPYYKGHTTPLPARTSSTLSPYGPFSSEILVKRANAGNRLSAFNSRYAYSPPRSRQQNDGSSTATTTTFHQPNPVPRSTPSFTQRYLFSYPEFLDTFLSLLASCLFPPVVVYLRTGFRWAFFLNLVFCFFELWPGVLHAFWCTHEYPNIDSETRNTRALSFGVLLGVVVFWFGFREAVWGWRRITSDWALTKGVWRFAAPVVEAVVNLGGVWRTGGVHVIEGDEGW